MIKFNLQHFAQVIDAFADEVEKKKKKKSPVTRASTPRLTPTIPTVAPKQEVAPVVQQQADNQIPNFLRLTDEQRDEQKRRSGVMEQREAEKEIVSTPTTTAPISTTAQDKTNLIDALAATKKQQQMAQLRRAFDKATGAQESRLEKIPGEFRTAQTDVRTRGDLAQKGVEKISAIGATGRGSLAQSALAQNVITQGQAGALTQQEVEAKTEIKNRIADLEADFAAGVANIEMEAEAERLQRQLDSIVAKEQQEIKQAEIKDQRDYDMFIRELDKYDDREMLVFKNEIDRENTLLDAEIQRIRDAEQSERDSILKQQLFEQAQVLEEQKAQNNLKLRAMADANAMARVGASTAGRLAEIEARGEQDRLTDEAEARLKGIEAEEVVDRFEDKVFTTAIENQLSEFAEAEERRQVAARILVDAAKKDEITTDDQLTRLMRQYGVSETDIDKLLGN